MDLTEQIRNRDLRRLAEYLLAIKLAPQDYLILDTETTGLGNCEIIELALIDLTGRALFNERIKPINHPIDPKAQEVHGITLEDVQDCRDFLEVWDQVFKLIKGKTLGPALSRCWFFEHILG
ncbi:MAG: 3'-5' exonuclease [Gloeocapsa sp. DLM2.Bin57]|nr:MAG: 3'-5' exonuclease [Gloeocapsa sp. DLM2.Bin57]